MTVFVFSCSVFSSSINVSHLGGYLLPPTERNGDWYSQHIQDVAPFFFHAQMVMKATSEKELQNLIKLCDWMHQPQVVSLCFSLLTRKEEKELHLNSHECLLLITAALERALGNVDYILY